MPALAPVMSAILFVIICPSRFLKMIDAFSVSHLRFKGNP
jgi:hypothetical protein